MRTGVATKQSQTRDSVLDLIDSLQNVSDLDRTTDGGPPVLKGWNPSLAASARSHYRSETST